ncbi:hypothetical protein NC652_031090 [Populus alba x Populus x berolinensis]|nr:hypothetical protein NC652_031090 [Populus alba x Populus x berolinensis]
MNRGFLLLLKPVQNKIVVSVKLVCVNHITAPADQHIPISMITAPPNQPLIKPRNLLLNRISPALCNC